MQRRMSQIQRQCSVLGGTWSHVATFSVGAGGGKHGGILIIAEYIIGV